MELLDAKIDAYVEWLQDRGLVHPGGLRDPEHDLRHPERSEGSRSDEILRFAQDDEDRARSDGRPATLEQVRATVLGCTDCVLAVGRKAPVFGYGGVQPGGVVFLGDGPRAAEDAAGDVFVGAERELLEKIAGAMRLRSEECFFTSALHCKIPDAAVPDAAFAACERHLESLLIVLKPRAVVVLGALAARGAFGVAWAFQELRGILQTRRELGDAVWLVTHHPRDLLRQPALKREAWTDLQKLLEALG